MTPVATPRQLYALNKLGWLTVSEERIRHDQPAPHRALSRDQADQILNAAAQTGSYTPKMPREGQAGYEAAEA